MKELIEIQSLLKVPKDKRNDFGGFNYRSAEQILSILSPMLKAHNCLLTLTDDLVFVGDRYYIKATATIRNESGECVSATAFAREAASKKGSDEAQITGLASSYARKYALGGLFCIDDGKDPDSMDNREEGKKQTSNPLAPASKTSDKPIVREGNDLWGKALAYCRREKCSAETLRKWYTISDADASTMNNILSEE